MNRSPARIVAVTGGLLVAGALCGIAAALIAVTIALGLGPYVMVLAVTVGGIMGAALLPATSWLLLRRVPLGLSFVGTTLGAMVGGIAGWIAAAALSGNPLLWPVAAAVIGFFAAVLVLRRRFSTGAEAAARVAAPAAGERLSHP